MLQYYLIGIKITSAVVLLSTQGLQKLRGSALRWSQCFIFHYVSPSPTPPLFPSYLLSSSSLYLSESFIPKHILASECECMLNVRRKENPQCYGLETSRQNTATYVGGHFIENINSHKQHLESNSLLADNTVL